MSVGAVVKGRDSRTAPFGAFVQIELPSGGRACSAYRKFLNNVLPNLRMVNSGDPVMVKVLRTRPDERKIGLNA